MRIMFLTAMLVFISATAWADSIYLQMPIQPDNPVYSFEDFKARYLELSGENIQQFPLTNIQKTHYFVGSWRLTQEIAGQLASEFPMVTISVKGAYPVGLIVKEASE